MIAFDGINKLGGYSHFIIGFLDAALQYVADTKIFGDLVYFNRFTFIGEG